MVSITAIKTQLSILNTTKIYFLLFFFPVYFFLIVYKSIMSLEIRSIGEVISYQATQLTEFMVGMGIIKLKTSENENITFYIIQFIPVNVEDPCYVTPMAPKDVVYFHGTVTKVDSSTQTINITCSHSRKISLDPPIVHPI